MTKLPPKAGDIAKRKAEEAEKKKEGDTEPKPAGAAKESGNPISSLVKPRERNFDRTKTKAKGAPGTVPKGPKMAVRMIEVEPEQTELSFIEKQDQLYTEIKQEVRMVVEQQAERLKLLIEQSCSLPDEQDQASEDLVTYKDIVKKHVGKFIRDAISRAFFSLSSCQPPPHHDGSSQVQRAPTISVSCQAVPSQGDLKPDLRPIDQQAIILQIREEQTRERQLHAGQSRFAAEVITRLVAQTATILEGYGRLASQAEGEVPATQNADRVEQTYLFEDGEVYHLIQNFEHLSKILRQEQVHRLEKQNELQALASAVQQAAEYIKIQKCQLAQLLEERSISQLQSQRLTQAISMQSQEKDLLKEICFLLLQQTVDIKEESAALLSTLLECRSHQAQAAEQSNYYLEYLAQVLELVRDRVSKSNDENWHLITSLKRESATAYALLLQGSGRYENLLTRYNQERDEWDQFKTDLDAYVKQLEAALSDTKANYEVLEQDRDSLSQELTSALSKVADQDSLIQSYQHQWAEIWGWIANQACNGSYPEDSILEALEFAKLSIRTAVGDEAEASHKLDKDQLVAAHGSQLQVLENQVLSLQAKLQDLSMQHQAEIAKVQSDHDQQVLSLEAAHAEALNRHLVEKPPTQEEDLSLELASLQKLNSSLAGEIEYLNAQIVEKDVQMKEVRQQLQEQHETLTAELRRYAETNKELESKYDLLGEEVKALAEARLQTDQPVETHSDELAALQEQSDAHLKALEKSEELLQEKVSELEGALQDKLIFESQLSLVQSERDQLLQKVKDLEGLIEERPAGGQGATRSTTPPKAEVEHKETQSDPEVIESDPEELGEQKSDQAVESSQDKLVEELRRQLEEARERIAVLENTVLYSSEPEKGSSEAQTDSKPASRSAEDPDEFVRLGGDRVTPPPETPDSDAAALRERVEEQENRINLLLLDLQEAGLSISQLRSQQEALTRKFVSELQLSAETNGAAAREFLKSLPNLN